MTTPADVAPANYPQVRLKIARRSSHPWIFQKMVEKPATRLPPGSVVDIIDRAGLSALTCECYGVIRGNYERLLDMPAGKPMGDRAERRERFGSTG